MTVRTARRFARPALVASLTLLAGACAREAPQNALDPQGPVARAQHNLFLPVFWIAAVIFFLVEGLILFAVIKFRDRPGREEPKQIHGNTVLEFTWTLIPALILIGVAIPTVMTIFNLSAKHAPNEVRVKVVAHQWWWEYHYVGTTPEVVTANELVIPAGRPVFFDLESADVVHSFWVPELAGKQDVVPERTNTLRFEADHPGEYYGQCAEFCSISHANMRLRVIAKTEPEFEAWLRAQQQPAAAPASSDAQAGLQIVASTQILGSNVCISCHAIGGVPGASGQVGPDLTHLASRGTFASALYDLNEENLTKWIRNAREQKPGVIMPIFDHILTDDQIRQVVAYLLTLR